MSIDVRPRAQSLVCALTLSRSFAWLMDGRFCARVLSHLMAGRRLVVSLLDGLSRIVVVSVHRHHGLLRRTAVSMEKITEEKPRLV